MCPAERGEETTEARRDRATGGGLMSSRTARPTTFPWPETPECTRSAASLMQFEALPHAMWLIYVANDMVIAKSLAPSRRSERRSDPIAFE
ncbi:hypothetical protein X899_3002 [Burkholderia pseudomallei TSV 25]|nr:hypothetical protein DO64_4604 [Burkholderia pseudomallei]KGW10059.1 hypothetical protein X899_3002 [Burkholderia pseudomallei TSV 25]